MKPFSAVLALLILLLISLNIFAQKPVPTATPTEDENDTVKISTNLIQVDVTVMDKDGNIVTDLKPGDLEIYENGKKQEVTNFSFITRGGNDAVEKPEKAKPTVGKLVVATPSVKLKAEKIQRTYTLVVDDLGLNFASTFWVKQALKKFVNEQLEAGDMVSIIMTGRTNGALSSFTSDKNQLLRVIDKIRFGRGRSGISTFESFNPDAIGQPSEEDKQFMDDAFAVGTLGTTSRVISGMRELPGRKAVILFSEGWALIQRRGDVARQSNAYKLMKQVADLANRASVIIYTIDPRGLVDARMSEGQDSMLAPSDDDMSKRQLEFMQSQQGLRILAEDTGGFAFVNQNDVSRGLRRAVADQSSYYLLGYAPDEETFNPAKNKFNKLEIKAVRPGLKLRYRSGFFGVTDQKYLEERKSKENNIMAALSSPFGASDIDVDLTSVYANDPKEGDIVHTFLNINAKDLSFTDTADGSKQTEFSLFALAFGENGKLTNSMNRSYQIKVNREDYQKMIDKGFVYFMDVPFKKPGAYQLRIALQDAKTKKIGAAIQFIEVPNLEKNRLTLSGLILQNYTSQEWESQNVSMKDAGKTQRAMAIRKFKQGNVLQFSYAVYNAKNEPGANFRSQIKLFKDGQMVFEGKHMPLKLAGNDGKRSEGEGAIGIGKELVPGDYVLQLIVFEDGAKNKSQIASQSVDFEIVD